MGSRRFWACCAPFRWPGGPTTPPRPVRRRPNFATRPPGTSRCSKPARRTGSKSNGATRATTNISRRWPTGRRASTEFRLTRRSRGPMRPRRTPTPTSTGRCSTSWLIESAVDDAYRLIAADAAGVRPNLGTAVMARNVIGSAKCRRRLAEPPAAPAFFLQQLHVHRPGRPGHSALQPSDAEERSREARRARASMAPVASSGRHGRADVSSCSG